MEDVYIDDYRVKAKVIDNNELYGRKLILCDPNAWSTFGFHNF